MRLRNFVLSPAGASTSIAALGSAGGSGGGPAGRPPPAAVHETFIKAWKCWGTLRGLTEEERAGWLIRVAVNTAVDVFRSNRTAAIGGRESTRTERRLGVPFRVARLPRLAVPNRRPRYAARELGACGEGGRPAPGGER
jgi:hypothetical protein